MRFNLKTATAAKTLLEEMAPENCRVWIEPVDTELINWAVFYTDEEGEEFTIGNYNELAQVLDM